MLTITGVLNEGYYSKVPARGKNCDRKRNRDLWLLIKQMGWCWPASVIPSWLTEIRRRKSTAQPTKHCWGFSSGERGEGKKNRGEENPGRENLQFTLTGDPVSPALRPAALPASAPFPGQSSGPMPLAAPTGGAAEFSISARCELASPLPRRWEEAVQSCTPRSAGAARVQPWAREARGKEGKPEEWRAMRLERLW